MWPKVKMFSSFCVMSQEVSLQHFCLGVMACQEKAKPLAGFFVPLCVLGGGCPLAVASSQGCDHCLSGHQQVGGELCTMLSPLHGDSFAVSTSARVVLDRLLQVMRGGSVGP